MVRRGLRGSGGDEPGKLSDDPAVTTAAVALLHGHGDPLDLLALAPDDYEVAVAVVNRASTLEVERRKAEIKALAEAIGTIVGNRVAAVLAKTRRS